MNEARSEPVKRKLRSQTAKRYSFSTDDESYFYLVSFDLEPEKYAIVNDNQLMINKENQSRGQVKDKGRIYSVSIIKKGSS